MAKTRSSSKKVAEADTQPAAAAAGQEAVPHRHGGVGVSDPRFWAFLLDWQFYLMMTFALSHPVSREIAPYIGDDNAKILQIGMQIGFVALFFSFMANRNRQLGYV